MRRRRARVGARRRDTHARRARDRSFGRARTKFTRAPTVASTDDGARRAIDADGDGEKANRRENDGADVDDARAREWGARATRRARVGDGRERERGDGRERTRDRERFD